MCRMGEGIPTISFEVSVLCPQLKSRPVRLNMVFLGRSSSQSCLKCWSSTYFSPASAVTLSLVGWLTFPPQFLNEFHKAPFSLSFPFFSSLSTSSIMPALKAGFIHFSPTPEVFLFPRLLLLNDLASPQISFIQHFPLCPPFFCLSLGPALSLRALTLPPA